MTGLALICSLGLVHSVFAFTWTEDGDAGELPVGDPFVTAQSVTGDGPLDEIRGSLTLQPRGDTLGPDVDMYRIFLSGGQTFSATTVGGSILDTQLFLFDSDGFGVYGNDDASGVVQSTLPNGSITSLSPVAPGDYFLAISHFNTDPVSVGGLIFPSSPFGDVHGPTGPGGASPISGWILANEGFSSGDYRIFITGGTGTDVPIPEPATLLLLGSGVAGVAWATRNRQRRK